MPKIKTNPIVQYERGSAIVNSTSEATRRLESVKRSAIVNVSRSNLSRSFIFTVGESRLTLMAVVKFCCRTN